MTTILEKTAGLVAFVQTVDSGSFSGAGRFIGSSPSAVSKSVARLERRLGVRLLQRSTRTLSLTTEGAAPTSASHRCCARLQMPRTSCRWPITPAACCA
jgi:hypothetical protein